MTDAARAGSARRLLTVLVSGLAHRVGAGVVGGVQLVHAPGCGDGEIAGGWSVAPARTFKIIDPRLKNPQTEHWERVFAVFGLLLRPAGGGAVTRRR